MGGGGVLGGGWWSRADRHGNMFMDRLPLVVVFGVRLAIGSRDRLRRLIGFESQIALFVFIGARFVTQTAVAEHQVVMRLQIFRINREGDRKSTRLNSSHT